MAPNRAAARGQYRQKLEGFRSLVRGTRFWRQSGAQLKPGLPVRRYSSRVQMNRSRIVIAVLVLLLLYPAFTSAWGLYGPDEPRYASIAREMARSGDFVTPMLDGKPWLEKPPLLYWLGAVGFSLGLGPEAAPRVPLGVLSVSFLLWFSWYLRRWFSDGVAACAAIVLATSAGWLAYSNVAVTDVPLAVCFGAAMLVTLHWIETGRARDAVLIGALFGLAVLAKGLVPAALAAPLVWFARERWRQWPLIAASLALVAGPWYWTMWQRHGYAFFDEFILEHHFSRFATNELQHAQPFWFYAPVLIGLLLPWSPVLVKASWRDSKMRFFVVWAAWGFVFFSAATNKLPGYLMPLLPALVVLIAARIGESVWPWRVGAVFALVIVSVKLLVLPAFDARLTARALAATAPPQDVCADNVARNLRYGLHYYLGRAVIDCWQAPGANPVPVKATKPGLRYTVHQNLGTLSGRLLVFASVEDGPLFAEKHNPRTLWIASRDVEDWRAGVPLSLEPLASSFPGPITNQVKARMYFRVVFDRNRDYAYAGLNADDYVSAASVIEDFEPLPDRNYSFTLDRASGVAVPQKAQIEVPSALLSRFHREPVVLRADVVDGETGRRVLVLHAHGESFAQSHLRSTLKSKDTLVFLHCAHKYGHHAFADSAVNGPWTRALIEELLPQLPGSGKFGLIGEGAGAYGAVRLQQLHPELFDGVETVNPDPLDFRNFFGIDLTKPVKNFYWDEAKRRRPFDAVFPIEESALRETVIGAEGGRWESWEAVFGPRTSEGISRQLFARDTGEVDQQVLEHWRKYSLQSK